MRSAQMRTAPGVRQVYHAGRTRREYTLAIDVPAMAAWSPGTSNGSSEARGDGFRLF